MADKIEREIDDEIGVFSSKKAAKVTLDDDLFGSPPASSTKPSKKKDDLFGDDDLFSSTSKPATKSPAASKKARPVEEDLFSSKPAGSSKKKGLEDSLFDKPPEDVFASASTKKEAMTDDLFAPSKASEGTKKLDDIFADAPKKRASGKAVEKKPHGEEEVDGVSQRCLIVYGCGRV